MKKLTNAQIYDETQSMLVQEVYGINTALLRVKTSLGTQHAYVVDPSNVHVAYFQTQHALEHAKILLKKLKKLNTKAKKALARN